MDLQGSVKFALSGFSLEDTLAAQNIITSQGGTVLGGASLHPESNCLLVNKLSRTEKVLSALAKGLPILDYNQALKVGFFQQPQEYQKGYLLDFDWGEKDQNVEPIKVPSFLIRQEKKLQFADWRVGLFLNDPKKAATYERILQNARAKLVTRISSPFYASEYLQLDYILSEPAMMEQDENFNKVVQNSASNGGVQVLSYLVVSEKLFREHPVQSQLFRLSSPKVRDLHKTQVASQYGSHSETSGRSYGRSASIMSNPEIKRLKCSSTPSIKKYFPVLQTKSLVNVDGGEKASTETISEDTSSLSTDNLETKIRRHFNAPRNNLFQYKDELKEPSATDDQRFSYSQETEKLNIGPRELKSSLASVGKFKIDQLYKICHESQLCLRIHAQKDPGLEPEPLQFSFLSFFETYVGNAKESEDEKSQLWRSVLYFLNGYVTNERYPNDVVLRTVLADAIRENGDPVVRRKASSVIKRIIVYNHPPSSPFMRSHYLKSFLTKKSDSEVDLMAVDSETFWNYFYDLMLEVFKLDKTSEDDFNDNGVVLLLDVIVFLIEIDLTFVVKEFLEKEPKTLASILAVLLWPSGQIGTFSKHLRKLVELYVSSLQSNRHSLSLFRRLLNMASLMVALAEVTSQTDENKNMLSNFLANKLSKVNQRYFWRELNLIKSDWLSLMVLYQVLHRIRKFDEVSLRQFSTKVLSVPFEEITQEPVVSTDDSALAVCQTESKKSKGIKRNKYGESPLHVACRNGNFAKVEEILKAENTNINVTDNLGWTPLHEAVSHGHLDCIKLLLNYKPKTIEPFFKSTRFLKVYADLEVQGGGSDFQGGINPLHDAVRCNQLDAAELLLQTILLRKGRSKLLEMLEKTTNSGHNVFQLCCTSQMKDLLIKYQNDEGQCSDNHKLVIDFQVNRFWLVAYTFFYKYVCVFRLHSLKELMKGSKTASNSQFGDSYTFQSGLEKPDSFFNGFLLSRSSRVIAEDIRTFWPLEKPSKHNIISLLTKKRLL